MIWNGKYLSIKAIIEKAYRDTGSIFKIDFYEAIEWAGECIELIGCPVQLKDAHECLDIVEFKAKLPCDLHLLLGVRDWETKLPLRYSTDLYHHALVCQEINNCECGDDTFTVNDDYMFTSFEEGKVELTYKALPTDDEGFPLIPDQIKFVMAVKHFLEERILWKGLLAGKTVQYVYEKALQDRLWYIGAANTAGNRPSPDQMESLKNNWLRMIPKINQHMDGFKSMGEREQRYTHNSKFSGNDRDPDSTTLSPRG